MDILTWLDERAFVHFLNEVSFTWHTAKTFVEHMIGFSHDALHVVVGVCLQLLAASFLKVSVRHPVPWCLVLGLQLANEWSDLWLEVWPDQAMQWGESSKDILLTMALPTLFLLVARYRPQLLSERDLSASVETDATATTVELSEV